MITVFLGGGSIWFGGTNAVIFRVWITQLHQHTPENCNFHIHCCKNLKIFYNSPCQIHCYYFRATPQKIRLLDLKGTLKTKSLHALQFLFNVAPVNNWTATVMFTYVLCVKQLQSWVRTCLLLCWSSMYEIHVQMKVCVRYLCERSFKRKWDNAGINFRM
jgi:hypothetical protein